MIAFDDDGLVGLGEQSAVLGDSGGRHLERQTMLS